MQRTLRSDCVSLGKLLAQHTPIFVNPYSNILERFHLVIANEVKRTIRKDFAHTCKSIIKHKTNIAMKSLKKCVIIDCYELRCNSRNDRVENFMQNLNKGARKELATTSPPSVDC